MSKIMFKLKKIEYLIQREKSNKMNVRFLPKKPEVGDLLVKGLVSGRLTGQGFG